MGAWRTVAFAIKPAAICAAVGDPLSLLPCLSLELTALRGRSSTHLVFEPSVILANNVLSQMLSVAVALGTALSGVRRGHSRRLCRSLSWL